MSLRTRVRALERRLGPSAPGPDAMPHLVTVYVERKAPACNPGPIKWGTIPGILTVFDRGPDESEDDFVARLMALTGRERLTSITIHAETLKPEPPEMSP